MSYSKKTRELRPEHTNCE